MPSEAKIKDLNVALKEKGDDPKFSSLTPAELFIAWFLEAECALDPDEAANAITDGAGDMGIDAIHIDHDQKRITIVQSKFHSKLMSDTESRHDVVDFASIATTLAGPDEGFELFHDAASDLVKQHLEPARDNLMKPGHGYELIMLFVTTGKCSANVLKRATAQCQNQKAHLTRKPLFRFVNGSDVMELLGRWEIDDAPATPTTKLDAATQPIVRLYDERSGVESWALIMNGEKAGNLIDVGPRLFARNIRGYLGPSRPVNRAMAFTLKNSPEDFFLLNNGVTIVCTAAQSRSEGKIDSLVVDSPQIINGQQTTYALHGAGRQARKANVFVRVIAVQEGARHDALIDSIVQGTNSQNTIKASDLRSNDRIQVKLAREFLRRYYFYVRKVGKGYPNDTNRKHLTTVTMKGVAEAWMAGYDAEFLRSQGAEGVFRQTDSQKSKYKTIFETDPEELLARWWLHKTIKQEARGYPNKAAARNIVNQLIWTETGAEVRKKARVLNESCRENGNPKLEKALRRLVSEGFKAADRYYQKSSQAKQGSTRIDVDKFFKQSGHFKPLESQAGASFASAVTKFESALADAA
jgi:hypothetical protein